MDSSPETMRIPTVWLRLGALTFMATRRLLGTLKDDPMSTPLRPDRLTARRVGLLGSMGSRMLGWAVLVILMAGKLPSLLVAFATVWGHSGEHRVVCQMDFDEVRLILRHDRGPGASSFACPLSHRHGGLETFFIGRAETAGAHPDHVLRFDRLLAAMGSEQNGNEWLARTEEIFPAAPLAGSASVMPARIVGDGPRFRRRGVVLLV